MGVDVTGDARPDFSGIRALASRPAGYAVAARCLEEQAAAERADPSLRSSARLAESAWSWFTGAVGEIEVGRMLDSLGPEWFVRHAVPIGAGTKDVDHLVIGPGGVFAINTKHHQGASVWIGDSVVKINNRKEHHVTAARRDGADAALRLTAKAGFPVPVTPVVALLNPASISDGRTKARTVTVLNAKDLVGWLRAQRTFLSPTTLDLVKLAAEEPDTWHVDPRAADTLRVMQRFERLKRDVAAHPPRPVKARPTRAEPRPSQSRRPATRPTARRRPTRGKHRNWAGAVGQLFQIWLACLLPIGFIVMLQGAASAPCASGAVCFLPALVTGLAPFAPLAITVLVGAACLRTLAWLVRALR